MVQRKETPSYAPNISTQVSPRGFKANVEIVMKALMAQGISATILAKLPRGSSWVEDLRQYAQSCQPQPRIYLLNRTLPRSADWFTPVLLPTDHPMQGEYELVVVADAVGLMLSGHRVDQLISVVDTAGETADATETLPKVEFSISLETASMQRKLSQFQTIFQASLRDNPENTALSELVTHWDEQLQVPDYTSPALLNMLFMQQAKHQERVRNQARQYRREAMTASSLTTQNEALLNTLRLKDDFLNTVGQELRTPLSTIKTALPLLASPNLKPPQRQRYLDMISRECDRQSSLINGVLDLLQLERSLSIATPEAVKLFDIVPGVVSTYQPIAQEKGIRLAYTVPNNLPSVSCPESWVRQIVIHLLNNSIRYTESGGEVWVTVQEEDEDTLILNLKDTGAGIPANELPHIFEHFYRGRQTSQYEEGAGLGLTIVQQLLLYCGGRISVDSQPSVGSHFKVRLPIYHNA
ncbi:MAG: ATP-binding protein [Cyanobacteria bacterium J06638_20]